jgi:hypothetical protein
VPARPGPAAADERARSARLPPPLKLRRTTVNFGEGGQPSEPENANRDVARSSCRSPSRDRRPARVAQPPERRRLRRRGQRRPTKRRGTYGSSPGCVPEKRKRIIRPQICFLEATCARKSAGPSWTIVRTGGGFRNAIAANRLNFAWSGICPGESRSEVHGYDAVISQHCHVGRPDSGCVRPPLRCMACAAGVGQGCGLFHIRSRRLRHRPHNVAGAVDSPLNAVP